MLTKDEIKNLDRANLDKEISQAHQDLFQLKAKISNQSSKETHKSKQLKRHIARLETAKNQLQ